MKGNEFKIILTDLNKKFDTLVEGQSLFSKKLDRHIDEDKKEFKEVRENLLTLKKVVMEIRKDLIWMINLLDKEAKRLGVPRQSIIKVWVSERLEKLS